MKKLTCLISAFVLAFLFLFQNISSAGFVLKWKFLSGNNVSTMIYNSGIFNQDKRTNNKPAFEWPRGSGHTAIFTTGLSLAAYVRGSDGVLRLGETMASFNGEWAPGYILNGTATTPSYFHIYSVNAGDNSLNNPDYANWYQMIPFGAPYEDVNNNGMYDNGIDIPGMRYSEQTIFQVLTDGFSESHSAGEGFGGGITNPLLKAEMHMTAWCYNTTNLEDNQFLKFEIINKNDSAWRKVYFGIVCDPDLGDPNDDYIGCDTSRNLGFCYNGDSDDLMYGLAPPAVGIQLLKGGFNRNVSPNVDLGMTSFTFFTNSSTNPPPCESDPIGDTIGAYKMLKGLKKDGSPFMNPKFTPPVATKFCYSGNPGTNTGWNEMQGCIQNCGGTTGTLIDQNPVGDRRFVIGSGADNFVVRPNEKQTILISQFISRGSSNLSSVTVLKTKSDSIKSFYRRTFPVGVNNITSTIPGKFSLSQNYPNPFNPSTIIRYQIPKNSFVNIKVYDVMGREVSALVNENLKAGTYEATFDGSNLSSGVYYYKITAGEFTDTRKMLLIK